MKPVKLAVTPYYPLLQAIITLAHGMTVVIDEPATVQSALPLIKQLARFCPDATADMVEVASLNNLPIFFKAEPALPTPAGISDFASWVASQVDRAYDKALAPDLLIGSCYGARQVSKWHGFAEGQPPTTQDYFGDAACTVAIHNNRVVAVSWEEDRDQSRDGYAFVLACLAALGTPFPKIQQVLTVAKRVWRSNSLLEPQLRQTIVCKVPPRQEGKKRASRVATRVEVSFVGMVRNGKGRILKNGHSLTFTHRAHAANAAD